MAEASALEFGSVTKTYVSSHLGRVTRSRGVEELSLGVAEGESFGLLGLNGSGKTTAFKLALGLLHPTRGEVRVLGRPPADAAALAQIGFLPELPYFYPYLTPRESLRFYGRLSGLGGAELSDRVERSLELVGLRRDGDRRMRDFSKGMIQRAGLAQAVLHDPRLIILDEPVSGLDPLAVKDFRDLLGGLCAAGKTLVLSSHSISEVEKLCVRVGVLKAGRLVRLIPQSEWRAAAGGLEGLFVETVR
ncbi:MAG: ABC transporter ATP-binding protein [Elusimicrobia bacterium]|nr:ABC transporter ATP-binding protein [Elusimicrobiota bacterium]